MIAAGSRARHDGSCPRQRKPPKLAFDSNRAWEHLRKQVSFGPRPSGTPAIVETRRYIIDQLKAAGIDRREQMFIGMTPLGEVSMVERHRHDSRQAQRADRPRQPLRHQAVSRVPVRRRQRRRLVHGGAARAGARAEAAPERVHDRAAVPRRRGGADAGVARQRQHLRQPALRRRRAEGRVARHAEGARAARHDRRPRSAASGATRTRRRGWSTSSGPRRRGWGIAARSRTS